MNVKTVNHLEEGSLAQDLWLLLLALLRTALRRSRANADPFDSGFLPS